MTKPRKETTEGVKSGRPDQVDNPPVRVGKLLGVYHYKGNPKELGQVGIVVDVVTKRPAIILVYEVKE